jgi:molybdopterin converting factor small subunit
MVKIVYPLIMTTVTRKEEEEFEFDGELTSLLEILCEKYPKLRKVLFNQEGFNRFINIYLNNEDIRNLDGFKTRVGDKDTIKFIPAIAGG